LNNGTGVWTGFGLTIALVFAEVAGLAGLAPIIGAFLAGLLLDDVHFEVGVKMELKTLENLLAPLLDILLPIFFVVIGSQVQLQTLASVDNLVLIGVLLVAAILSKAAAGFVVRGKEFDALGIGLGMVPRGEVGLIFAAFAYKQSVFSESVYSVVVFVVLLTTVVGPIALKPRLRYLGGN
jgi:Kef-type K+ transport system membrane component KefB